MDREVFSRVEDLMSDKYNPEFSRRPSEEDEDGKTLSKEELIDSTKSVLDTIFGEPVTIVPERAFLPSAFAGKGGPRVKLPQYQPTSEDELEAEVKPFIYFAKDGAAYWCRGGKLRMKNLRFELEERYPPGTLRVQATVDIKFDLIGETTEPYIRNERVPEKESSNERRGDTRSSSNQLDRGSKKRTSEVE
jgi:hypothetical protein